jgi:lipopolysaccharide transport system ATP-binding protein
MQPAIEARQISKSFRRYRPDRPHTLQEVLARGLAGLRATDRFWALRDVSLSVAPGRAMGLIGTNGSGKSTLLRLVAGVGRVDSGSVTVRGRIGALLDLGAGFHPDLTGRENAVLAGVLSGLTRRDVLRRLDEIVAFAEVEPFIDNPTRTYSSGMQMRLAFSTAVHTNPDVLLIDEVLAVGDLSFQRKCLSRIDRFKADGCSILLVSHGLGDIETLCDEAVWLDGGRVVAHGSAPDVIRQYEARHADLGEQDDGRVSPMMPASPEDQRITAIALRDADGGLLTELASGRPLSVDIDFEGGAVSSRVSFRVRVVREDGLVCYDLASRPAWTAGGGGPERARLELERVDLNSGRYRLDVWVTSGDQPVSVPRRGVACDFTVVGDGTHEAVLNVPHQWEIRAVPQTIANSTDVAGEPR